MGLAMFGLDHVSLAVGRAPSAYPFPVTTLHKRAMIIGGPYGCIMTKVSSCGPADEVVAGG